MLHLELPHVNVLSKVDLIAQYGDLGKFIHEVCSKLAAEATYLLFFFLKKKKTSISISTPKFKTSLTSKTPCHLRRHDLLH
jgi:hypothetical protein